MLKNIDKNSVLTGIALCVISVFAGLFAVIYSSIAGEKILLLAALPLAMILGLVLFLDKRLLFLLVMLFRASCDTLFDSAKFGGSFGVGALANILLILIGFLYVIERPKEFPKKAIVIWGPVALISIISIFYAPSFVDALRTLYTLFTYFSVFLIAFYLVKSKKDFDYWVNVILLSSVIPFLYAFVDIALHSGLDRLKSTFGHPNIFAFYLVLIISLCFYKIKSPTLKTAQAAKLAYFAYMALLFGLLMLTQTRSAWVSAIIIFAAYGVLIERRYLLYMCMGAFFALLLPSVRERVLDLGEGNQYVLYAKLNSYAWRKMLWDSGLKWMSPIHYIYGYGLESFKNYSTTFFILAGNIKWGAHSVYVQWFFETGILGFSTLTWAYFKIFSLLKDGLKFDKVGGMITLLVLAGYLLESYSDNMLGYLSFNWYFWFFMGMSCALVLLIKDKKTDLNTLDTSLPELSASSNKFS